VKRRQVTRVLLRDDVTVYAHDAPDCVLAAIRRARRTGATFVDVGPGHRVKVHRIRVVMDQDGREHDA